MVIIVTGGIGSGKSEACRILESRFGFPIYDADSKVKELYETYPEIVDNLEAELSCILRDDENKFVPSLLAARIFTDRAALETVENTVFPYLIKDFEAFSSDCETTVLESATILEKESLAFLGDVVILIDAPVEERLARACARDGADRARIKARMDNQILMNAVSDGSIDSMPADSSLAKAYARVDYRILNTGSLDELEASLAKTVNEIRNK